MTKKGKVVVGILLFLVLVVVVSSAVLLLVQSGLLIPKDHEDVSLVNVNFIPFEREDNLVIKDVELCVDVEENLDCFFPTDEFYIGDDVYVRVEIDVPVVDSEVSLVRNYRIINPKGEEVLSLERDNEHTIKGEAESKRERVVFADVFSTTGGISGEYQLQLVVMQEGVRAEKNVFLNLDDIEDEGEYDESWEEEV